MTRKTLIIVILAITMASMIGMAISVAYQIGRNEGIHEKNYIEERVNDAVASEKKYWSNEYENLERVTDNIIGNSVRLSQLGGLDEEEIRILLKAADAYFMDKTPYNASIFDAMLQTIILNRGFDTWQGSYRLVLVSE